jgi:hypothetical protein
MDSGSRSSGGAGFDDEDGLTTRREVSSSLQGTSIPLNLCEIHPPLLLLTPANDVKTRSLSRLLTVSAHSRSMVFFKTPPSYSHSSGIVFHVRVRRVVELPVWKRNTGLEGMSPHALVATGAGWWL